MRGYSPSESLSHHLLPLLPHTPPHHLTHTRHQQIYCSYLTGNKPCENYTQEHTH